jgi:hypothetical protein
LSTGRQNGAVIEPLQLQQWGRQWHHHHQQPLIFMKTTDDSIGIELGQRADEMRHPEDTTKQRRIDECVDFVEELALAEQHAELLQITVKTVFVKRMFFGRLKQLAAL